MLKHIWSVICERVSNDEQTKLLSYLTCVEQISTTELPAKVNNLVLGSRWFKTGTSNEVLRFRLKLIYPDSTDKVLIESGNQIVKDTNSRINIILDGIILEQGGMHLFDLEQYIDNAWNVVCEIPLNVALAQKVVKEKKITKKKVIKMPPKSTKRKIKK